MTESEFCEQFTNNIRIGNIELRKSKRFFKPRDFYIEVVKYYPNSYYQQEDNYIFDEECQMYTTKNAESHCYIDPNCFKSPESCISLAIVDFDDDEPDIRSVGSRPWDMLDEDMNSYNEIIKEFYKLYYKLNTIEED